MAYVKHNFSTGDTLYASQLNEMDTQILANETAAANAKSVANTAKTTADSAKAAADAAKTAADAAKTAADNALPLTGGVINGTLAVNGPIVSSADIIDDGQLVTKKYVDSVAQNSASAAEPAEDDMPKVFIDGTIPTTKDDMLAELTYISKSETFHAYIKIKCQGSSSMSYPKKNFTVKLYSDEARVTELPKLFKDWGVKSSKFVLKANYIDHSHARNIVCARLWDEVVSSRADYDSLPAELRNSPRNGAIDGFPIKVYTNGTYQGVYTWNIGKDAWMWGMDEDNANHVLLCGEANTDGVYAENACNFRALWSGTDEDNWSVEVGTNSDAVKSSLNALISCVKDTDDATLKSTIGTYLDVQSAIDYYIFQYTICGLDGLAKNLLLATYNGTKWICGAYDLDSTIGLWWSGGQFVSAQYRCPEDYQEKYSLLWERIASLFDEEVKARYVELRSKVFTYSNMFTHFERFTEIIGTELYVEDLAIYSEIPSGKTNNIKQIRDYIKNRLAYVDAQIMGTVESDILYELSEAVVLDGESDYIDTGVKLFDTAKDFTLYVDLDIAQTQSDSHWARLFGGEVFDSDDTANLNFYIADGGNYPSIIMSGNRVTLEDIDDGLWGHTINNIKALVFVYSSGLFAYGRYLKKNALTDVRYINSAAEKTYTVSNFTLLIGAGRDSWSDGAPKDFTNATINKCKIFNRALTEEEVNALLLAEG